MELDVINFTNIDKEDFEGMWGGEITVIKAGQTKPFPKFLAEHYCKHLVNKMLIRRQEDWTAGNLREPLEKKILGEIEIKVEEEKPEFIVGGPIEAVEFAEAPVEEPKRGVTLETEPKKKGGRPKRVV